MSLRVVIRPTRALVPRAGQALAGAVRHTNTEGVWKKKEKAIEEQYFQKVDRDATKSLADKIHRKELAQLLALLPEKHGLSEHDLHKILEWKHNVAE